MGYRCVASIEYTALLMEPFTPPRLYIAGVLIVLRENEKLLENEDYQRLYEEGFDFLYRYFLSDGSMQLMPREKAYGKVALILNCICTCVYKPSLTVLESFLEARHRDWNDKTNYIDCVLFKKSEEEKVVWRLGET